MDLMSPLRTSSSRTSTQGLDGDIMSSTWTFPPRTSSTGTSSAGTSDSHRDVLGGDVLGRDIYVHFYFCPFVRDYLTCIPPFARLPLNCGFGFYCRFPGLIINGGDCPYSSKKGNFMVNEKNLFSSHSL